MTVLVIAEHNNIDVNVSTLNTISAAKKFDNEIHVLVIGYNSHFVAYEISKIIGVSVVLFADEFNLKYNLVENVEQVIIKIARNYSHILIPSTSYGKNILPRIAAKLNVSQISDVINIIADNIFERYIYSGNIISIVKSYDEIILITVRITCFKKAVFGKNSCVIKFIYDYSFMNNISIIINRNIIKLNNLDLKNADIVVSGGRGLGSLENYIKYIYPLANKLGAAIGASRAAVDSGYISNSYQIGQTGLVIAPKIYFAIGISGSIQHIFGMKDSNIIIAINKDKDAPIFNFSNYGIVGDLFKIIPDLLSNI